MTRDPLGEQVGEVTGRAKVESRLLWWLMGIFGILVASAASASLTLTLHQWQRSEMQDQRLDDRINAYIRESGEHARADRTEFGQLQAKVSALEERTQADATGMNLCRQELSIIEHRLTRLESRPSR